MIKNENPGIFKAVMQWLTSHPWLKIIALILAVMTWYYVKAQLAQLP